MSSLVTTKLRKKNIILEKQLIEFDIHKTLASILSARAIDSSNDIDYKLEKLIPYCELSFAESAANFILDMILAKKNILIIGDYDADGATASACAIKGLEKFGANVDFLVPNRFEVGYGLSVSIVEKALEKKPDLINMIGGDQKTPITLNLSNKEDLSSICFVSIILFISAYSNIW